MTEPLQDHEVTQDIPETRRFVICGDDTLAYRLADELAYRHKGHVTVIMRSRERGYGPRIAKLDDIRIIEADRPDVDAFTAADFETAEALALVQRDDVANVDAALSAHEVSPGLRQVVRIFNPSLSEGLAQLPYCTVLSDTAMAAPALSPPPRTTPPAGCGCATTRCSWRTARMRSPPTSCAAWPSPRAATNRNCCRPTRTPPTWFWCAPDARRRRGGAAHRA